MSTYNIGFHGDKHINTFWLSRATFKCVEKISLLHQGSQIWAFAVCCWLSDSLDPVECTNDSKVPSETVWMCRVS